MNAAEQVKGLRDAAQIITSCAEMTSPIHGADSRPIGVLSPPLARPVAATLRSAAEQIERAGHALGLPVSNALEIAGLVLGADLGHNR